MQKNDEKVYYKTSFESPLGNITLGSDGVSLVGLWFEEQKYFGDTISGEMLINDSLKIFTVTKDWLNRYFDGKKPQISELPIAPMGGEFRQSVWNILTEIPYGEVITYGELARKIAEKREIERMSAQAVGGAVGHNPLSIIIPCHRVIGANGKLTGYAGGIQRKILLLRHEGVDVNQLYLP